jgi:hypothetical protein
VGRGDKSLKEIKGASATQLGKEQIIGYDVTMRIKAWMWCDEAKTKVCGRRREWKDGSVGGGGGVDSEEEVEVWVMCLRGRAKFPMPSGKEEKKKLDGLRETEAKVFARHVMKRKR